jgi:hypothetical protein
MFARRSRHVRLPLARKTRQHVSRPVGGMNLDDVAVLEGKVRYGDEGAVTHDENMPARQLEEALDIGDVFAAAIALPRRRGGRIDRCDRWQ